MCNSKGAVNEAKSKPDEKIDEVQKECPLATLTVKVVTDSDGKKISDATVTGSNVLPSHP